MSVGAVEVRHVSVRDPEVRPLLEDLHHEYTSRYGPNQELSRYPDEQFAPAQGGAFLVLVEGGRTIAGGAFRRYDEETAELKRIWTHPDHRRRGLGLAVVRELEREAGRQGYRRIYLTTGPRQPEAAGLYLAGGYVPLYDLGADPETVGPHPFEKVLRDPPGRALQVCSAGRRPAGAAGSAERS
ncbi:MULTISPECIES: GNAT family N-acetyltransferase [Streptosporangium]|uniref:Polar amino acid transport system permease protein n=1 Tax=Streptosporangium brasiliense TaxID=47480 RepID=A0ABT9QY40_9ACTN|nr:GNAT family N-acetyltransferase [Streptosporangium brasiliense]MDP9861913.1 polar amino acid transport system permease protein [Streptosporangium brasiliense]